MGEKDIMRLPGINVIGPMKKIWNLWLNKSNLLQKKKMLINRKEKSGNKKKFKNLKKTKWRVKSSLKAIVSFNGEARITDNVINLLWVMASWKSKWNLTWRKKIKSIDCILPLGFRDWVPKELQRVGCVELLNTVQRRVRPKLHVFGGIHEGKTRRKGLLTYCVLYPWSHSTKGTLALQRVAGAVVFSLFLPGEPFHQVTVRRNTCA